MPYSRVLLIEDDDDDQEIFLSAIKEVAGSVVCMAESCAREALHKLETSQLSTDLIFLDLNMPVMSGQQFLAAVKSNTRLRVIPVIIFSTTSHPKTIQEAKALGAENFITKPNNYDELKGILQSILE